MKNSKRILVVLAITLIIVLAFLAHIEYNNNNQLIPTITTNTSNSDNVDTSEWKTYTNSEFGFQFKYPPYVKYSATQDMEMSFKDIMSEYQKDDRPPVFAGEVGAYPWFPGLFSVMIIDKSKTFLPYTDLKSYIVSVHSFIEGRGANIQEISDQLKPIEVSNVNGYYEDSFWVSMRDGSLRNKTVYLEKGPYMYTIFYVYGDYNLDANSIRPDIFFEITPKIFESFKFTD